MAHRKVLVTGGTVFVSRSVAEHFAALGDDVYILNRNSRPQPEGVTLIEGDRSHLSDQLKQHHFDAVLDVTAYTGADVENLLNALGSFDDYVMVSSSAIYPETLPQPFLEEQPGGPNSYWGAYGTNKLEAEKVLRERVPHAYILRPPYLYGPKEILYRSPFVFECAEQGRTFCMPQDSDLKLQFFHVRDLCRFVQILLEKKPEERVYNVGNPEAVTVREWVNLCYEAVGVQVKTVTPDDSHPRWCYFPFRDYEYFLDVTKQQSLMQDTMALSLGLAEEYQWFRDHREDVNRKPYFAYIDENILKA